MVKLKHVFSSTVLLEAQGQACIKVPSLPLAGDYVKFQIKDFLAPYDSGQSRDYVLFQLKKSQSQF